MIDDGYDLIIQKLPQAYSQNRPRIAELISRELQTDIVEIEASLERTPFIFKQGATVAELVPNMVALLEAGALAMIIPQNSTARSNTDSSSNNAFRSEFELFYKKYANGLSRILQKVKIDSIYELMQLLLKARQSGARIFFMGNGGSAAIASHAATDFAKDRFPEEKYLFRVISLTDNTSLLTATANDFGYENIFVKQLKCLMQKDDVVVAISSSGNSPNVIKAVEYANQNGADTVGIVGFSGGELGGVAKHRIHIPTKTGQYGFAEDISMIIIHMLSVYIYEQDQSSGCASQ